MASVTVDVEDLANRYISQQGGMTLIDMLVKVGLYHTKSQARRGIEQSAVKINQHKVYDVRARVYNCNGAALLVEQAQDGVIDITTADFGETV